MTLILIAAGGFFLFLFGVFIGFVVSKRSYDLGFLDGQRHGCFLGYQAAWRKKHPQILDPSTEDWYDASRT